MRIGYPCINRSIGCTPSKTFRLASYTDENLRETVAANLSCLKKILAYNAEHGLLFFRITSDIVPFASHPVCTFPWQVYFSETFAEIGQFCRNQGFRISMHPDQFVLLNSPDEGVRDRSILELAYHVTVLDLMGLDRTAKVQIHIGGVYGNKAEGIHRFVQTYAGLAPSTVSRLVIENDERLYSVADCLSVHEQTGIPVVLDVFHHALHNNGEQIADVLAAVRETWGDHDGLPMIDYSSQEEGKRPGAHAEHLVKKNLSAFLLSSRPHDFDLMLEIKDKEKSAAAALMLAAKDTRLVKYAGST